MSLSTLIAQVKSINSTRQDVGAAFDALNPGWQSWTPTYGGGGSLTFTSVTTRHALYRVVGNICFFTIYASGTTGGSEGISLTFTYPVPKYSGSSDATLVAATAVHDGSQFYGGYSLLSSSDILVRWYDTRNWGLGSGRRIYVAGHYPTSLT